MRRFLPEPPLLVVSDRRQARRPLAEVFAAAFAGGCRWASLREKELEPQEQIAIACELVAIAHSVGARLTVHGTPALVEPAGADGVHLPAGANAVAARAALGPDRLVGISVHTVAEAKAIDPAAVDYAVAGPAFATASKPGYGPSIGREGLAKIARATTVPVLAIGGIEASRVAEVITAGCAGIAVMGAIMRAANPAQETRSLVAALADALSKA